MKMRKTMKAAILYAPADLRYEDTPMPECNDDDVLVAIHYCGICGSDISRVLKRGTYHFPTIPGHELSGIVAHDPRGEWTGKRVTVFPLIPCRECDMCRSKYYELCSNYDYYGSRRDGGYAEYLAVKRWNLLELPDAVSLKSGSLCEPLAVAHHAVTRLQIKQGDKVLISGAGPIALLAAQWLRIYGAEKVYLFDVLPEKVAYAKTMGFEEYDGSPVDAALEGTGFSDALERCLEAVKPQGHLVLMGNPSGTVELSQKTYWKILRKELTVRGTWNSHFGGTRNDWTDSIEALRIGAINVDSIISHVYPLSMVHDAFQALTNYHVFTNRVVLHTQEQSGEI